MKFLNKYSRFSEFRGRAHLLSGICASNQDHVNSRVKRQSNINREEIFTEPFKKTAKGKIRRFLCTSHGEPDPAYRINEDGDPERSPSRV